MGRLISASAPGRCGILGNPSDIYGGSVLSCSIPARARCTLELDCPGPEPTDTRLWRAVLGRYPLCNVTVTWETAVPRSSGLSGSTALLAASLAAVRTALGSEPALTCTAERIAFAEEVRDIERYDAEVMCGFQDAYMICNGGIQLMSFVGKRPDVRGGPTGTSEPLDTPLPFLLITTGVERLSGSVHGPMADRWLKGEPEVVDTMTRLAELAPTGAECLALGDYQRLANLMNENQARIAALGGSGDPIDRLVADCREGGALAAKLAGAGMGGTVIALCLDPSALESWLRGRGYSRFLQPEAVPGARVEQS